MSTTWTRMMLMAGALTVATACGGVGHNGGIVGGACDDDRDCAEQCAEGGEYPDGTCTVECDEHRDCPGGTWCIDKKGGICLLGCDEDSDCRPGYDCESKKAEGDGGDERVCID